MNKNWIIPLVIVAFMLVPKRSNAAERDAAMNLSYLGEGNLPRGMRNNNPGNIRINPSNNWQGKITPSTDGAFEQFNLYVYGIRAMIKLVKNYISRGGQNTIRKIVFKYAPPADNNHSFLYAQFVTNETGIDMDAELSGTFEELSKIIPAMAAYENGRAAITPIQFIVGYGLI